MKTALNSVIIQQDRQSCSCSHCCSEKAI